MDIRPQDRIRSALILRHITGSKLAKTLGVHRSAITQTINGKIKAYWLRQAIADAINVPLKLLWPDAVPCKRIRRGRKPGKKESLS